MGAQPTFIGRYEIISRIGQGGMGTVYLARDPIITRRVAIKLLKELESQELRDRFTREAMSAGNLNHPNIVTIYDVGDHHGQPFITMEYIHGETLADIIHVRSTMPLVRKLQLCEAICHGLGSAHRAGIVHRDIKPANLIVNEDGVLKILDFGIAHTADSGMTGTGMLVGTLNYMSPEQVMGRPVDARSDVFALGAVMYELLSYTPAFPGGVSDGILYKITVAATPPLREHVEGLPAALYDIVDRTLHKEPAQRYQDLKALREDIARVRERLEAEIYLPETLPSLAAWGRGGLPPHQVLTPPPVGISPEPAHTRDAGSPEIAQINDYLDRAKTHLHDGALDAAADLVDRVIALDSRSTSAFELQQEVARAREALEREERVAAERVAAERAEEKRVEQARAAAERAEAERAAAERAEEERVAAERVAAERAEEKRVEEARAAEKQAAAKRAADARADEKRAADRQAADDRAAKARADEERAEKQRSEARAAAAGLAAKRAASEQTSVAPAPWERVAEPAVENVATEPRDRQQRSRRMPSSKATRAGLAAALAIAGTVVILQMRPWTTTPGNTGPGTGRGNQTGQTGQTDQNKGSDVIPSDPPRGTPKPVPGKEPVEVSVARATVPTAELTAIRRDVRAGRWEEAVKRLSPLRSQFPDDTELPAVTRELTAGLQRDADKARQSAITAGATSTVGPFSEGAAKQTEAVRLLKSDETAAIRAFRRSNVLFAEAERIAAAAAAAAKPVTSAGSTTPSLPSVGSGGGAATPPATVPVNPGRPSADTGVPTNVGPPATPPTIPSNPATRAEEPAVRPITDQDQIRATLESYAAAMSARDANAVARVFRLEGGARQRLEDQLADYGSSSHRITMGTLAQVDGTKATVRVSESSEFTSKRLGRPVTKNGMTTFFLEKINGSWMITAVK